MIRGRHLTWLLIAVTVIPLAGCSQSSNKSSAGSENTTEHTAEKGPVKLVVRTSPREPRLSDLIEMQVEVTAQPDIEIKPPAFGQAVGDFVVRDYSEVTHHQVAAPVSDRQTRQFHYKLEPMSAGRHLIRSIAIDFVDNRADSEHKGEIATIETEPFEVNVTSDLGNQIPDLANLEPMVPPQPLASGSTWLWLELLIAAVLIGFLIIWSRRRRIQKTVEIPKLTPEQIAHAALSALLAEDLPGRGLIKEFYLRLTGIVRQYIEDTTGLRAPDQTTEEFLQAMRTRNVFTPERSIRLQEFLEAADMVKYAGQQPDATQIESAIDRAREFVDVKATAAPTLVTTSEGV